MSTFLLKMKNDRDIKGLGAKLKKCPLTCQTQEYIMILKYWKYRPVGRELKRQP